LSKNPNDNGNLLPFSKDKMEKMVQPKSGQEALEAYDVGYLRWIRLTANDTQLLGMRDEIRFGRENMPQMDAAIQQLQHERVQILSLVAALLAKHCEPPENQEIEEHIRERIGEGFGPLLATATLTQQDFLPTQGNNLDINADAETQTYLLTLTEGVPQPPPGPGPEGQIQPGAPQ
jgi:chorismate mutase